MEILTEYKGYLINVLMHIRELETMADVRNYCHEMLEDLQGE